LSDRVVRIERKLPDGRVAVRCVGVRYDDRHVVTAAHCALQDGALSPPLLLDVRTLSNRRLTVVRAIAHPRYDWRAADSRYDFALIEIAGGSLMKGSVTTGRASIGERVLVPMLAENDELTMLDLNVVDATTLTMHMSAPPIEKCRGLSGSPVVAAGEHAGILLLGVVAYGDASCEGPLVATILEPTLSDLLALGAPKDEGRPAALPESCTMCVDRVTHGQAQLGWGAQQCAFKNRSCEIEPACLAARNCFFRCKDAACERDCLVSARRYERVIRAVRECALRACAEPCGRSARGCGLRPQATECRTCLEAGCCAQALACADSTDCQQAFVTERLDAASDTLAEELQSCLQRKRCDSCVSSSSLRPRE
jgi:hypothetical protein